MPKVLTLGETMAAFTPAQNGPLRYVGSYQLRMAGAESNLAIGLAKLGCDVAWISRLGEDEFGQYIRNTLRGEGVDCSGVIFDSRYPTGVMFKETAAGETKVFYYRQNSAASHLSPADLEESRFQLAEVLHLTGITPVLSESCRQAVDKSVELAKRHGVKISFDPNIRRKLWGTQDYTPLLRSLLLTADLVLAGQDELCTILQTEDVQSAIAQLQRNNSHVIIAVKNGAEGAIAAHKENQIHLAPYPCRCVDPIGAGDAFNAGFLAGILQEKPLEICGKMGCIAGAMATETTGDFEGYPSLTEMGRRLEGLEEVYR